MTKRSIYVLSIILIVLVFCAFNTNTAKSKSSSQMSVGVVSIKKIFDECKKNVTFKEEMAAEQQKIVAEIEKVKAEYDAELAGLKTLKVGSDEYNTRMKELITKKSNISAQQEYYSQQMAMKERRWILDIYKDIVTITKELARENGLDLVLENSEVDLENVPDESLVMSILMRSAIHAEGCKDITDEVMSRLDSK